jgi:hypothetical protein
VLVGGVFPVTFNIKALFNISPVLPEKSKSSASCKVSFNSNSGFSFANGATNSNNSGLQSGDVDKGSLSQGASSKGTDQIGVGLGFEFPRLEVGLLHKVIVPYAVHKTTLKTFFDPGYFMGNKKDKCFQAACEMKGSIGVKLDFFGFASYKYEKDIYVKNKQLEKKGNCDGDL